MEGNLEAEDIHAQYVLKAVSNCEIVDGGTEEKPDPTRPVINAVGVSYPIAVDNKCEDVKKNAAIEIEDSAEDKSVKMTLKNCFLPIPDAIGLNSYSVINYTSAGQAQLQGVVLGPLLGRVQVSRECRFDDEQFDFNSKNIPLVKLKKEEVFKKIQELYKAKV